ncbi:TIGR03885 family FMN-dependent LLM class oxidoreductase [Devosia oryziradicis]|uniref:TIGR03885 family FMN-dependent LLM class oxidoreductase n=1 Tax=Devosia oryziradicis TaxID=2801335 RepID=A0ABX7BTH7_9HYPH|nr:TIGR03885 family FMN-dependent LLM class oxidoreductase [Devosia oryziradicis]QQR34832.1 TIGR03885 family FMN-dependent LLM class oxidoreductase [Devosia oryziradicis]
MTTIGFHASHEQFAPSALRDLAILAEQAGFQAIKTSDHFHPWSERQGQSGFAWSWLGAAMQATTLPFGAISAPGYRYHPAVLAQAAATCAEMFPDRLWLALGSGEAINEAITGDAWPEKAERNARLAECAAVMRALFDGETVTHRGRITVVEAKLYSRPERPVPLFGAAITPQTAAFVAGWADGLLTASGGDIAATREVVAAFRKVAGDSKPIYLQHALSWAETEDEALGQALDQWGPVIAGGEVNWDLRRPADFDSIGKLAGPDDLARCLKVSSDVSRHLGWLGELMELGVDHIYLHNVGRNQRAFVERFGPELAQLAWTSTKRS